MSVLDAALYDNKKVKYHKWLDSYGRQKEKELTERKRKGFDKFLMCGDAEIGIKWVIMFFIP